MTIFKASFALVLVVCTGCAGRAPNPVSVVQVQDRYMDCPAIYAEVQSNNQRVQELAEVAGVQGRSERRDRGCWLL